MASNMPDSDPESILLGTIRLPTKPTEYKKAMKNSAYEMRPYRKMINFNIELIGWFLLSYRKIAN